MNINNIALVRATSIIPFDGLVKPLSDDRYLTKNIADEFSGAISSLLEEEGIMPPQDYQKTFEDDTYYDSYVRECAQITKEYLPYVSDYNSIVLFSINGLCPDDSEHGFGNNTFSNKPVAIIEPLKHHIDETISLVPTDTAIKGTVKLSKEAIILINKDYFDKLTEEEKNHLLSLPLKITLFSGNLKESVQKELQEQGINPEELSLSSQTKGIKDSETSDELKELIDKLISEHNLSNKKYFNLITARNGEEIPKYDLVKDEYPNAIKIYEHYIEQFLSALLTFLNAPDNMKIKLHRSLHNNIYMKQIAELIKANGLPKYKDFLDSYNANLENQRVNGILPTPNEILGITPITLSDNDKQEQKLTF